MAHILSAARASVSGTFLTARPFTTGAAGAGGFAISATKPQTEYASVNPATGTVVKGPFPFATETEVEKCLASAHSSFFTAPGMGQRAAMLNKASAILKERVDMYAGLITLEMGKPITASKGEVLKCADMLAYTAEHGPGHLKGYNMQMPDQSRAYVSYQPIGAVMAVMPWNFPFWQVFRFAAPALLAGNTAVVKHAPNVPQCALAIEEVFREAGFGFMYHNTFMDIPSATRAIADDRIAAVTLTGSNRAGESVAAAAGKALKKSVLELGGSDPFIVLEDADIPKAVQMAVASRLMNGGQSCISAKRFIVDKKIIGVFSDQLCAAMAAVVVGDPMDPKTTVGPLARWDLRTQLHDQVERSVKNGAKVLMGGKERAGPGFFYETTVMRADTTTPAFNEELFGPVSPIFEANDTEHAVALANNTAYGLGGTVFTRNIELGEKVASRMDVGMAFVNGMVKSDPRLPFGGVKRSGYGRECSFEGIREFVNIKTTVVAPQ